MPDMRLNFPEPDETIPMRLDIAYRPDGGGGAVDSVNGKTGNVTLYGSDIKVSATGDTINTVLGRKADEADIPRKTSDLQNDEDFQTGEEVAREISERTSDMATETWVGAQGFAKAAEIPVTSVNGKTGAVALTPADIGIGAVFTLKGSVATKAMLPETGNTEGDVYYVISESVGYIWLNDGTDDRWEMLGLDPDLSEYATIVQMNAAVAGCVPKVEGYGLSKNDFTDALKARVEAAVTDLSGYSTTTQMNAAIAAAIGGAIDDLY